MRIDFTNFGVETPENSKASRAGQAGNPGATAGSNSDASVSSSSNSPATNPDRANFDQARVAFDQTQVQSLKAQVLAQPEIREARVQPLQQAIEGGGYSVSPGQVADALVSDLGAEARG